MIFSRIIKTPSTGYIIRKLHHCSNSVFYFVGIDYIKNTISLFSFCWVEIACNKYKSSGNDDDDNTQNAESKNQENVIKLWVFN